MRRSYAQLLRKLFITRNYAIVHKKRVTWVILSKLSRSQRVKRINMILLYLVPRGGGIPDDHLYAFRQRRYI